MEILIFLVGFLIGAICVFIPFNLINKNNKVNQEVLFEQMKLHFENTANKIFKESSQELSEQNKEKLDVVFKRFKDKIEDFEKRNEENFKVESENFTRFDINIKNFLETGNKISQDANSLVSVMRSDNRTSGKWGEIVLERVLEASGLRKDEEYKIQKGTAEGRPDATIFLPENRCVFIDSKTSFAAWFGFVNTEDELEKEIHLKSFIDSTKAHIAGLAKRDYSIDENSPDFVLMFIPIESCYSAMFCEDCTLWDLAWKNKIMPVSPSTLLSALKIINSFHVVDRQNKNAIEISRLCTSMLDKFASLLNELLKIKTNLNDSLKKLNGTGNIINQIKKIENLGGVMTKNLPELPDELVEVD
ncbi:MAG: DNA recombination protein RmuC [Candidatus Gastranaerophilales bacterium]